MNNFLYSGKLPRACIHSVVEDQYSAMYKPREKCACGCINWKEKDCTMILGTFEGKELVKAVHKCSACDEVRLADLIEVVED